MTLNPAKILHHSHIFANEIAAHINGTRTISAPALSACGIAGPTAVRLAAMIHAGVGGAAIVGELRQMGMSSEDAITLAGAIAAKGPQ
jgi:hypothetical protein